jgi:hypothetical protein
MKKRKLTALLLKQLFSEFIKLEEHSHEATRNTKFIRFAHEIVHKERTELLQ